MLVWICDTALIFKIMAFYPSQLYRLRSRLCFLIIPFSLVHFSRLGLLTGVLVTSIQFLYHPDPLAAPGSIAGASSITLEIAQTALSVVENIACTAILINKVRGLECSWACHVGIWWGRARVQSNSTLTTSHVHRTGRLVLANALRVLLTIDSSSHAS